VLATCSCLLGGASTAPDSAVSDQDQIPSDFELWAQGKSSRIMLTSGQESLTNFREQFSIQIRGEDDDGNSFTGSQEYLIENDRISEKSRELETIQIPSRYLSGVREWVVADGFTYLVQEMSEGGRDCDKNENPTDTSHYSDVHVTRILQSITPGDPIEENMRVQDVLADVYEIEDLGLLFVRQLDSVIGKVWISQQPTYFLKAEGVIEGVFEFENILYNGEASFSYEIKDFDQVEVQLPALCAYPPEDMIPMPTNAQDVQEFPNLFTFSSPDPVDNVLCFYLDELVLLGWQVEEPISNHFEQIIKAQITSPQNIQLLVEVKIIDMPNGSRVQISWQAE
jgi:hypothetical protein